MLKKRSKVQKRLAKVVMAALLCTGGGYGLYSPSVAEAVAASYRIETDSKTVTIATETAVAEGGAVIRVLPGLHSYGNVRGATPPNYLYPVNNSADVNAIATGNYSGYTVNVNWDGAGAPLEVVRGAHSNGGTVTENTVNLSGGTVKYIYGGYSYGTGDAKTNHVNITGGTVTDNVKGGGIYGYTGAVALAAEGNTVKISGGTIGTSGENRIIGGDNEDPGGSGNARTANNNTVEISGGTINSTIMGGYSYSGNADNNEINISGGTISEGSGYYAYIYGGSGSTSASHNTVTIKSDASVSENTYIYGGVAETYAGWAGTAADNTVNILKAISVQGLYGGIGNEKSTGNTLNIAAKNVVTKDLNAFQNMNFYLPSDIAKDDTMLTVNGSSPTNVKDVTFGVAALSGVKLVKGDTVNLITNPSGLTTDDTLKTTDSATLAKAEFLSANSLTTDDAYELSISKKDANTIIATVDNVTEKKAPEEAVDDIKKSPVETRAGVVTLLNAGTDMLVSQGMANAAEAAAAERSGGNAAAAPRAGGFAPFAAVGLGNLRAESGSHVDTKSIGLNLGFAREIENKSGKLLVGPVVEYGHGSYDSYQDNGITADGKSSYWGIGVIAKQTNNNGFYYEGSIRAGRTKSDYGSDNVKPGTHVSYDSSATYWALHLGAGKLVDIGHSNTLDYYGKYFYSHTGSDSAFLNGANETANFDAVNSHRIRLGARITHAINEKNNIYGGLAWQYEFNGDARATYSVSGEAPSPSVKGSSGMIELGWQVKPGKSPMTIDLGVTGWVGKQRGITANVQANWTF